MWGANFYHFCILFFSGIAGLAVTYGLNLNMLLTWVIWNVCQLENKIISVERILQYTSIASEPPLSVETNKLDSSWPSKGEIELRNLQVTTCIIFQIVKESWEIECCLVATFLFCDSSLVFLVYGLHHR